MINQGFIQAIADDPDNDVHRLVYADWLEDNGEPERAEHIRLECEMFSLMDEGDVPYIWECPRFYQLSDRAMALARKHSKKWFSPLLDDLMCGMKTRRGFPYSISMTSFDFVQHAVQLFEQEPTIESVEITNEIDRSMSKLAACPALALIRDLEFTDTLIRLSQLRALAKSPYLGSLRRLVFSSGDLRNGPDKAQALVDARSLTNLEQLSLRFQMLRDKGAIALLSAPRFATLKSLDLSVNELTDESMIALADADHLQLTSLDVRHNRIGAKGLNALAHASHLRRLEKLAINGMAIGEDGAAQLAEASFLSNLRELSIADCGLTDEALSILCRSEMPTLHRLIAGQNAIGEKVSDAWSSNGSWTQLRSLDLEEARFEVDADLNSVSIPSLRELRLFRCHFDSNSRSVLLHGELLRSVRTFILQASDVTDEDVEVLSQNPAISNVVYLSLEGNEITDRGAMALANSPHLDQLQFLKMLGNDVRKKGKRAMKDRFGSRVSM